MQKDGAVADDSTTIELSRSELREVAGYAVACARPALAIFERDRPDDQRPRVAIDAAQAFADGAERTKALRDSAWAAQRAAQEARDAGQAAASDAARAALASAGAAFLHPLAKATQVKHVLGSAAHAARAFELAAGDDPSVGADHLTQSRKLAPPVVVDVLRRYPAAPSGGGRVGELIRLLDASLRDFQPIVREGIARLARASWAAGRGVWDADGEDRPLTVDAIDVHEAQAAGYVADVLGLEPGEPIIVRDRRYLLDGRPVLRAVSSLPASIAAGTPIAQEDTGPGGVYARLADLDLAPAHFREDLRARMPSDDEASTLDLDAATPVVTIARTAYTSDGRAVEFNEMTLDASVYVLRYDFDA